MAQHNFLGSKGEDVAMELLRRYAPQRGGQADLVLAGGVEVEVKAARASRFTRGRRQWQFCLRRDGKDGVHCDVAKADVLVCLCFDDAGKLAASFVFPVQDVGARKKLVIPSLGYGGRWAGYLDAWKYVDECVKEAYGRAGCD